MQGVQAHDALDGGARQAEGALARRPVHERQGGVVAEERVDEGLRHGGARGEVHVRDERHGSWGAQRAGGRSGKGDGRGQPSLWGRWVGAAD